MVIARKGAPGINYLLRKDDLNRLSFQVHSTTTNSNYALGSPSDWGPDAWYHVAGVWEGDTIKVYVNGVLVGDSAASGTPLTDGNVLHFGDNTAGAAEWRGVIDEVRISNRALTATEIAANYTLAGDRYYWRAWASDGTNEDFSEIRYFDVGTPVNDPEIRYFDVGTPVNDPPVITLLSPPQDSSTSNHRMALSAEVDDPEGDLMTVWVYGDAVDASDLLYVEEDVVDPTTINHTWTAPVLGEESGVTAGLWHFDDGSGGTASDATSFGHDGTITGATWSPEGRFGYALDFDGTGDYVEIANTTDLQLTSDFTVEAWVRADNWPSGVMVILRKGSVDSINYLLRKDEDNLPSFQVKSTTTDSNFALGSATDWGSDEWHYVVGTWEGDSVKIYVDGALAGSDEASGTPLVDSEVLHIGDNTTGSAEWEGLIDEVRITARALTATEIADNYTLVSGTYSWKVAADDGVTLAVSETRTFDIEPPGPNDPPVVTLLSPPDDSTTGYGHMELSADVDDPDGDLLTVSYYGDQNPTPTTLLYQETGVSVPATMSYDWYGEPSEFPVTGNTLGLWRFNENTGSTAADATVYGHDGTITGATWVTGQFGSALDFDGDNDRVEVPSTTELEVAGPMTIEAWINPRSFNPGESGYNVIARKGGNGGAYRCG